MRTRLLTAAVLWCGLARPVAPAQELRGAEREAVLSSAREHYYSLTGKGVRSFTCGVRFDFGTLGKGLLPPEDKADRRLLESATFMVKVSPGGPMLGFRFPQGSVSQSQDTVAAVTLWVSELVQGFFQTWPPRGFAGPVPESRQVRDVVRDGDGYRILAKVAGTLMELHLDREFLVTEVIGRADAQTERPQFNQTPEGLVYAGGGSVETDAQGKTQVHHAIESARVDGVLLPRQVHLQVGQFVDVRWAMDGCTVERRVLR